MQTLKLSVWTIVILAAFSSIALAGDYAHFHFIGFSNGGKYLAFEEYGINDELEDSSAYSVIYIVDVDANKFATLPLKANGDKSPYDENLNYDADKIETEVRNRNRRHAAKKLKRFGIINGNTGLQVAAHLMNEYDTDYEDTDEPTKEPEPTPTSEENANTYSSNSNSNSSPDKNNNADDNANTDSLEAENDDPMSSYLAYLPQQVSFTKAGNALYRIGYYQIKIRPIPMRQKNCEAYERQMFSFEMTLRNETGTTKLLQDAGEVPKSRGCVDGYGIQEAFLYKNKLAVFVAIFTRGWEGENLRLMAVTGDLDD